MFVPEILLHVSRGVRWDSDHVVVLNDDLAAIGQELVRGDFLERTHIGLDFFDASINRVAAWVIGTRNMLKSLLAAMLEPTAQLRGRRGRGRLHVAAGAAGRVQDAAVRRGLGLLLRNEGCAGRSVLAVGGQTVRVERAVPKGVIHETSVRRSCAGAYATRAASTFRMSSIP